MIARVITCQSQPRKGLLPPYAFPAQFRAIQVQMDASDLSRPSRRLRPTFAGDDADEDDLADTVDEAQHATVPPKAKKARRSSAAAPLAAASGISQETEVIGMHHRPVAAGRVSLCPRRLDVENGTLLSVRLVNFKSHRHFEMTFGPRLNFIVGRNGTGKSSILAAIIVALGGNPNKHSGTAGGSKSASSLICDGADSASVELHIANGGPDAFTLESGAAPATLIVRLRLSRASATRTSSTYSINDSSITLKKVRELADFYNYEVENPTVINTQAVSASFLKDPKDAQRRYTFFLRAANLESLKMDYAQGHDELRQMGSKLDSHEETRARLYERLEEAQQRADAARERLDLERTIAQQERRAAYCTVAAHRAALERARAAAEVASAAAEVAAAEAADAKEAHATARRGVEATHAERKARLDQLDSAGRRATLLGKELKDLKKRGHQQREQRESALASQRDAAAAEAELRRALEVQRASLDANTRAADVAMRQRIEALEDAHAAAMAAVSAASLDLTPLEQAASTARAALAQWHGRHADASREQHEAHAEATRLHAAATSSSAASGAEALSAVFHRAMPQLLKAIHGTRSWQAFEPVGPLGMHLCIKAEHQPTFGFAIERALGGWGGLSAFVVGCQADEVALRALLGKHAVAGVKVVVQKEEPRFNVGGRLGGSGSSGGGSGGGGGGGGLTVLDALEHIKSDIAFNALVNAASPEGCALLRSYDDVDRLVFGPRAPFARAYTPDGTAHFRRGRTTASEPVPKQQRRPQHMAPFLCADRPGDGSDERRAEMLAQSGQQAQVAQRAHAHAAEAKSALEQAQRADKAATQELQAVLAKKAQLGRKVEAVAAELSAARDEAAVSAPAAVLGQTQRELDESRAQQAVAVEEARTAQVEAARLEGLVAAVQVKYAEAQQEERALTQQLGAGGRAGAGSSSSGPGAEEVLSEAARQSARASEASAKAKEAAAKALKEVSDREALVDHDEAQLNQTFPEGPPPDLAAAAAAVATAATVASAVSSSTASGAAALREREKREKAAAEVEAAAKLELSKLYAKLKKAERRCGESGHASTAELLEAAQRAQQDVYAHEDAAEHCAQLKTKLDAALKERYRFWCKALKARSAEASGAFNMALSHKGLSGELLFNHDAERLDAIVDTSSQDVHGAFRARSLKSLSGGEQAFSALSFALAMWPFSASPLRAMDEFDKNMDSSFLQASLKLILDSVASHPLRQTLILTPNDYHGVLVSQMCKPLYEAILAQDERGVSILHMPNVERGA